ncbi:MAG: c-type cytochrome [Lewinellaceae bacterium]|nr:c-type cytochrome [Lewinellaceae bacterium]
MKRNPLVAAGTLTVLALLFACKKDEPAPTTPPDANTIIGKYLNLNLDALPEYAQVNYPVHYNPGVLAMDNAPSINRVTNTGAVLGRVLFYDKNLSRNNTVACASCHSQAKGFTDDLTLSEGFDGGKTGAHSMRLANANFYAGERMFWDKRAQDIEDQSTQPIKDHTEMGFDDSAGGIDSLIRKLQALEYYPILFEQAFGSPEISEEKMQRALAQFIRSMVSTDSKFDQGYAQEYNPNAPGGGIGAPFSNFTQQENQGKMLFTAPPNAGGVGCAGCHQPPTFALAANSLNNGLDIGETTIFKAPSLKNIAVAGPYMHDGRFATLEQVVEHYNSGIQPSPTLDNRLRTPNGQPLRLNLDDAQKQAIVAFLNTLTDNSLLAEERFSDPFK